MILLYGLFERQNLLIDLQDQRYYLPSAFIIPCSTFDILNTGSKILSRIIKLALMPSYSFTRRLCGGLDPFNLHLICLASCVLASAVNSVFFSSSQFRPLNKLWSFGFTPTASLISSSRLRHCSAFSDAWLLVKASWIAAHKTRANLRRTGIHPHPTCGEIGRIHEIVAQRFANPCLFAFIMMTTQRAFMDSRFSYNHFLMSSGYFSGSKNALPSLSTSQGFPVCLRCMSSVSSRKYSQGAGGSCAVPFGWQVAYLFSRSPL